jgi:hypothetical protein
MSVLENFVSLRRRQCEEQRRYLAGLESLARRLRADRRHLRVEIDEAAARGGPVAADPLFERHGKLERSVATIEAQIAAARAALAAAEDEVRQHEFARARRLGHAGLAEPGSARRTRRALGTG